MAIMVKSMSEAMWLVGKLDVSAYNTKPPPLQSIITIKSNKANDHLLSCLLFPLRRQLLRRRARNDRVVCFSRFNDLCILGQAAA